jgi:hypothetical protein
MSVWRAISRVLFGRPGLASALDPIILFFESAADVFKRERFFVARAIFDF